MNENAEQCITQHLWGPRYEISARVLAADRGVILICGTSLQLTLCNTKSCMYKQRPLAKYVHALKAMSHHFAPFHPSGHNSFILLRGVHIRS